MTARRPKACVWCRRPLAWHRANPGALQPTRDHVVPKSQEGKATAWCCLACNQIKGDMNPHQWARFMDAVPQWWLLFPKEQYRGVRLYIYVIEGLSPTPRPGP